MTATDELRRMLDERGIEYRVYDESDESIICTCWEACGFLWDADDREERIYLSADRLITPEQVIAATLGTGTCRKAERDQLKAENARLREVVEDGELHAREILAENAKLRELCADMYGFIKRMDEDCGDVTFSDCFDYCKHDTADDGCCKTGECWYEQRLSELGIEVDE